MSGRHVRVRHSCTFHFRFHGSFRRTAEARQAAARVARPREADPRRLPAAIELRPPESAHTYHYQLHRLAPAG